MTHASESPAKRLAGFMAEYDPRIVKIANGALRRLRKVMPGAVELVYDFYAALVVGFSPTENANHAILSIGLYPRWVNLYFLRGSSLPDPHKVLRGSGKFVRSVRLDDARDMDSAPVKALLTLATAKAGAPLKGRRRMIIKAAMARRRTRRPAEKRPGARAVFQSRDAWERP